MKLARFYGTGLAKPGSRNRPTKRLRKKAFINEARETKPSVDFSYDDGKSDPSKNIINSDLTGANRDTCAVNVHAGHLFV